MPEQPNDRRTIDAATYQQRQQAASNPTARQLPPECAECRYPKRPGEDFCPPCPHQDEYSAPTFEAPRMPTVPAPAVQQSTARPSGVVRPSASRATTVEPIDQPKPILPTIEPIPTPEASSTSSLVQEVSPAPRPRMTYNPYTQPAVVEPPRCRLTPIPRMQEAELLPIDLDDTPQLLDRNRVDPENLTISGNGHAQLDFVDGQWYVRNLSSVQTTYLRVDGPTPIKAGDVLLLGDRMFRFEIL